MFRSFAAFIIILTGFVFATPLAAQAPSYYEQVGFTRHHPSGGGYGHFRHTPDDVIWANGHVGNDPNREVVYEQIPEDRGWFYEPSPVERFIGVIAKNMWIRTEYLHWDFMDPGDTLLGAPVSGIDDPTRGFQATDAFGNILGTARILTTNDMHLRDNNGFRGTVGVPLTFGSFEAQFFVFGRATDEVIANDFNRQPTPNTNLIGTSVLENGNVSNLIFFYDNSFSAEFKTQVWGFDTDVVVNMTETDYGWNNSAVVGFKYLDVRENLIQRGIFDNLGTIPPITSVIDSATQNSIYGPSFGIRTEYRYGIFSIGAEPKLMFGVNSYDASVETFDLRQLNDINVRTDTTANQFAAVFDLALQAKVKVREGCVLTVGYDFMWVHGVTRPDDNIFYNDNGGFPTPPGIVLRTKKQDFRLDGWSIGGEFSW